MSCKILRMVTWPNHAPFRDALLRTGWHAKVNLHTKFEVPNFARCRNIKGDAKCRKWGGLGWSNKDVTWLLSQWQCTISQQETVPDCCQPNDWRKRWDLVSRRNVSIEEAALVCGGRLFHARAAATGNARSLRVDRWVDGTSNVGESTDHRRRWFRMSAAGFLLDTPVLCHAHSDTQDTQPELDSLRYA